jgi:hypothetical protein
MAMSEAALMRKVQVALTDKDTRLFRNNVGSAWRGRVVHNRDGSITIHKPQLVHFGLCPGSSDLIGLRRVVITPDMLDQEVALFIAAEVKLTQRPSDRTNEQLAFVEMVLSLGGRAGFASDIDGARSIVEGKM